MEMKLQFLLIPVIRVLSFLKKDTFIGINKLQK